MDKPRPVTVQALIERPPAPPWIGDLPTPTGAPVWHGYLLDWRWTNKDDRTWTAQVRYTRDGLTYEHWVSGELLDVVPEPITSEPHSDREPLGSGVNVDAAKESDPVF